MTPGSKETIINHIIIIIIIIIIIFLFLPSGV